MRILLYLLIAFALISCNSREYTPSVPSPDGTREGDDGSSYQLLPFSGDGTVQLANRLDGESRIAEQGLMHLGLKEGAWVKYDYRFSRDAVESVFNYKDGVRHGPYFIIDGGQLKERGTYYAGLPDGTIKKFNRGLLTDELNYKNGKINGMVKRFYEDGTLKEEGNFIDGQRDGTHKWYNQAGEVIIEYQYKMGQKIE